MRIQSIVGVIAALVMCVGPLHSQVVDPIKARQQLDSLRIEREKLEAAQRRLQGSVTDKNAVLRNIAARTEATNRIVNVLEQQLSGLNSKLERSAAEMALAQDNLAERKAVLNRRLADIYKRGPLRTFQVLLAAESFGDLVARYKYLYLSSRQDRALVEDVQKLTTRVVTQRNEILGTQTELTRKQREREAEVEHYSELADETRGQLKKVTQDMQQLSAKLSAIERSTAAVNDVLARLERDRKARDANAKPDAPPAAGRLTTSDMGSLEWPVDGELIRTFGPETLPTGGVVTNHGISIAAPMGTPVRAIAAGTVGEVRTFGIFGLAVILEHGTSNLSLYMQLQSATVKKGQQVAKGALIGTVGGANSDLGRSHLYFEIRGANQIALDPISWLRSRRP